MAKIKTITAREVLDAKGNPTIEATVELQDQSVGIADVPNGTSIGAYEAVDLRDSDSKRFLGRGVLKAIDNINNVIAPKLIGMEATNQSQIDNALISLDGTQNKAKLGANATLAVSIAACKAAAKSSILPTFLYIRQYIKRENLQLHIPTPVFNIINGGKHAGHNLDFQEFLLIPATSKTWNDSLQIVFSVYNELRDLLMGKGFQPLTGDEGGFAPKLETNSAVFDLLTEAISGVGYNMGYDVFFGLDAAASSFVKNNEYQLKDREAPYSVEELITYYSTINQKYHLLYLEDALAEDDWDGWTKLSDRLSMNTIIVGDDLTATNPYRLQTALSKKTIGAIIIKPNQIGTVMEAIAVVEIAREAGLKIVVSHRSGETNDDFIADFAVGVSADYFKLGAPNRGERISKYNRLSHIQDQLKML